MQASRRWTSTRSPAASCRTHSLTTGACAKPARWLTYGNMVSNSFGPHNAFVQDAAPVLDWVQAQSQRESLSGTGFGAETHAAVTTGELSAKEAPQVVRSLLTAGVDTTVGGAGAVLLCLATHPAQFQALRGDPGLARAAFEEPCTARRRCRPSSAQQRGT